MKGEALRPNRHRLNLQTWHGSGMASRSRNLERLQALRVWDSVMPGDHHSHEAIPLR